MLDEVATRIWHVQGGRVDDFKGPYADYLVYAEDKKAAALVPAGRSGNNKK